MVDKSQFKIAADQIRFNYVEKKINSKTDPGLFVSRH